MSKRIVISSGHGAIVRGASGIIDEVEEARLVVEEVAAQLRSRGVEVTTFHDNDSTSQNENLNRIVDFHNAQTRDLDISVHFNAFEQRDAPVGCEVLYLTAGSLAAALSGAIALSGFIDRGAKKHTDLFFLNNTDKPAVLLEICFVDSVADCEIYGSYFKEICADICDVFSAKDIEIETPADVTSRTGTVSWFGGPEDSGVAPDEGLAFIYDVMDAPHLFLPVQPPGTTGLARRLNPFVHYIACRWNYDEVSKEELLKSLALVRSVKTGFSLQAFPADWGPNIDTDRLADISPGLMQDLGLQTDDEVEVIFPYREDVA